MDIFSLKSASKIYDYYYNMAIKDFNHKFSVFLAKIPADYVYYSFKLYPNCPIDKQCFMEHLSKNPYFLPIVQENDIIVLLENIN